jgi:antitoxin MazE
MYLLCRYIMKVQVRKWGNSLALRIPKSFAVESKIEQGSTVEVSLESGKIVFFPVVEPEVSLEELLAGVTAENLHSEIDTGTAVGQEAW